MNFIENNTNSVFDNLKGLDVDLPDGMPDNMLIHAAVILHVKSCGAF